MMSRLMIQVTHRQAAAIVAEAERLGVSVSDVIRRVLDVCIAAAPKPEKKR